MKTLKNMAQKLVRNTHKQSIISDRRNKLEEKYRLLTKENEEIAEDDGMRAFISEKLCESMGLDTSEGGIAKFKEEHPQKYSEMTSSSINSESGGISYTTSRIPEEDSSYFHPMLDKWEIHEVEFSNSDAGSEGKYKFTVECVKQRAYIGGFHWIPKLYSTDWLSI